MKRSIINVPVLILLWISVLFEWQWVWGLLFLWWTIPGMLKGEVHVVVPVKRLEQPVLFWLVGITWIALSLWLVGNDLVILLLGQS